MYLPIEFLAASAVALLLIGAILGALTRWPIVLIGIAIANAGFVAIMVYDLATSTLPMNERGGVALFLLLLSAVTAAPVMMGALLGRLFRRGRLT